MSTKKRKIEISPSILSADFANLEREINILNSANVERIHLDVMDGHFVPNITFGPPLVKCIREKTNLILESHLMIEDPLKFLQPFKDAGSDIIIIHKESLDKPQFVLEQIKKMGIQAGISINPATPWESIKDVLELVDIVLIMTVNPGFGGQKYIFEAADKMQKMYEYIQEKQLAIDIGIDGGINLDTIQDAAAKGANVIIAGAAIFNSPNIAETIRLLREKAEENRR